MILYDYLHERETTPTKAKNDEINNNIVMFMLRHAAAEHLHHLAARKNEEENTDWQQQTNRSLSHTEYDSRKWMCAELTANWVSCYRRSVLIFSPSFLPSSLPT